MGSRGKAEGEKYYALGEENRSREKECIICTNRREWYRGSCGDLNSQKGRKSQPVRLRDHEIPPREQTSGHTLTGEAKWSHADAHGGLRVTTTGKGI